MKALAERGRIAIFNRSYYEELLVVRVHPEILEKQQLHYIHNTPQGNQIWQQRFEEINNFEKYLVDNSIIDLKFYLNVSKKEQKEPLLGRIESPEKHWRFSASDVREGGFWDDYMTTYEEVFNHTSTEYSRWYIIPADRKWFTRLVVSEIFCTKLKELNLQYPRISEDHHQRLLEARKILESED